MKNFNKIAIAMLALVVLYSCDDILDTEPDDRITNEKALEDYDGVLATLIGGYDRLRDVNYYQRDFIVQADALADNLKQTINNTSRLNGISDNTPYSHFDFWTEAYRVINSANFVIEAIGNITDASAEELDQVHAEALFLRALAHFDLVRAYARNPNFPVDDRLGIPIITTITPPTESFPFRNSIDEVYNQVVTDLTDASILVNSNSGLPNRASAPAIQALLARVQLYAGNWTEAEIAATAAITSAGFDIETADYTQIFSNQSETIFGLSFLPDENPGLNGSLEGVLYIDPASSIGYGDFVARESILDLYEDGDVRSDLYTSTTKSGEDVDYVGKYLGYGGVFGLDHIPLIRLSEVILTRAEARVELGDLDGAESDLNRIRNRAGLDDTPESTPNGLRQAILEERRLELAFEGHRIFDLKRRGMDIPKGTATVDCQSECSIPYSDFRVIANIPISETDVNENLQQNPGY